MLKQVFSTFRLDLDEVRIYVLHILVSCIMLTDLIVSGVSVPVPALLFLQSCTACCRAPDLIFPALW